LAAAFRRRGVAATALVRTDAAAAKLGAPYEVCPRPESAAQLRAWVLERCTAYRADALVVDTFPEGLLGELDPWPGPPRLAVLRCRRDADTAAFRAGVRASARAVDLEPHLEWCPAELGVQPLGPITRLGVDPVRTAGADVLIVASEPGVGGLASRLEARLRGAEVEVVCGIEGGMLSTAQLSAKVLIGPAGFNLSYEAQAMHTWHIALPRVRSHDDQARRAEAVAHVPRSPEAVERLTKQLLQQEVLAPRRAPLHSADALAELLLAEHG
jgi:hypothetical protein